MQETETILPEDVYNVLTELLETGTTHITKPITINFMQTVKLPLPSALKILWATLRGMPVGFAGDMEITREGIQLITHIGTIK